VVKSRWQEDSVVIVLIHELGNDVGLIERRMVAKVGVVVDHDLKRRGVEFHLEICPVTLASCQYDEQICQNFVVVMTETSVTAVVVAESEMNENGRQTVVAVVEVDEAQYDAVTSEAMRCRA
jgi:hypothetical protein